MTPDENTTPQRPDEAPTKRGIDPRQIHTADQLSGYMGLEAMNTGAYFRALLDAGFYRHEALAICKLQVVERFRAAYTAKPTSPPPGAQR
jgi:hypothetical protein